MATHNQNMTQTNDSSKQGRKKEPTRKMSICTWQGHGGHGRQRRVDRGRAGHHHWVVAGARWGSNPRWFQSTAGLCWLQGRSPDSPGSPMSQTSLQQGFLFPLKHSILSTDHRQEQIQFVSFFLSLSFDQALKTLDMAVHFFFFSLSLLTKSSKH